MRLGLPAGLLLAATLSAGAAHADDLAFKLTLKDHKFTPLVLTIPANTKVRFLVTNLDTTPAEFESDDFKAEKVIPAGKTVTVFIPALKAGAYEIHDEFNEDVSKTQLIVK